MNEIIIGCNIESPQDKNSEIKVFILNEPSEKLLYKFIVGMDGSWETLKDFGEEKSIQWKPEKCGKYILMVQAKNEDSTKAFDYVSRRHFTIGELNEKLIKNVYLDKDNIKVGEKITATVEKENEGFMYRYFLKEKENWVLAKDYSPSNSFTWTGNASGKGELLVQCKFLDSEKAFEDAVKVYFNVENVEKVEIIDFKCLTSPIIVNEELVFSIEAKCDDIRTTLYKFIRINNDGQAKCLQDYSTKKLLSYNESSSGEYRLLCLAKDMYSDKEYDDRAILHYNVIPYEPIRIESFTSDLASPQVIAQNITLKAIIKGGRDLRYRYIIEGTKNEDSGYIRNSFSQWEPKESGDYKITLWVKDISSKEKYEAYKTLDFTIDDILREPIKINEVIINKTEAVLTGEEILVNTIAEGGIKLLYSFIVNKDGQDYCKESYQENGDFSFTPKEAGRFQIEVRVKDKYSEKNFDAHYIVCINVYDYIPASIDYILTEPREYYLVGDQMVVDVIMRDTKNTLLKYVLSINGHKVEETEFVRSKRYIITPKCSGRYSIKVYCKNEKSNKEFDALKEVNLMVKDAPPIMNTLLSCDKVNFYCNEPINVTAQCNGGKDVVYEFYLMEKGEWILVQSYSKKDFYTFIPFIKGKYKILVLTKSGYKKKSYEDYCMIEIKVADKFLLNKDVLMNFNITEEEIKILSF